MPSLSLWRHCNEYLFTSESMPDNWLFPHTVDKFTGVLHMSVWLILLLSQHFHYTRWCCDEIKRISLTPSEKAGKFLASFQSYISWLHYFMTIARLHQRWPKPRYFMPCEKLIKHLHTVETLYSTIYYSKYFIELNFDKSTQYVALWTHKRHPIPRPFGRAMECLLWVLQQKLTVL